MKSPSTQTKLCRRASISYFLINTSSFCCPFFLIPQLPTWYKQNGTQTHWRFIVACSFRINLDDTFSHISTDYLGIFLSSGYLWNFLSNLYVPHGWNKVIGHQTLNSCSFSLWVSLITIKVNTSLLGKENKMPH